MKTRLTELFDLKLPVIQAPMAFVAGGALAAAVSRAGGLGLIGGGYGDPAWIETQFALAGDASIGCGFISFALDKHPDLLEQVLERKPRALFLSFADPAPLINQVRAADVPLICQVQTFRDACNLLDLGVDVIVAQGSDAGGHGESRGSMALVPEIADEISRRGSDAILCAAGGVADGRGLVAAQALGAEGVVMGTRFWGASEALVDQKLVSSTLAHSGDDTVRTRAIDVVREIAWPERYTARVLNSAFVDRWNEDLQGLREDLKQQHLIWSTAAETADTQIAAPFVGEAIGLVNNQKTAAEIILEIKRQTQQVHLSLSKCCKDCLR